MESSGDEVADDFTEFAFRSQRQKPQDRRDLRVKYNELIEAAEREKENEGFNPENINRNMEEADRLFSTVCTPREAMLDAKLLSVHSETMREKAHAIQTGMQFNPVLYMQKLATTLMNRPIDNSFMLSKANWLDLGNRVSTLFNRTPTLNFIHGTLESTAVVRQRKSMKDKQNKAKSDAPKVINACTTQIATDKTFEEIQRIKKILNQVYISAGEPVCYFDFVVDPASFSRTIENMFHLSFLIKEREAKLYVNSNKLPVVEPVEKVRLRGANKDEVTYQSLITMNVKMWKEIIKVFKIHEATIPPPPTAAGSSRKRNDR